MHIARPATPRLEPIPAVAVKAREAMKDQPINAVNVTATMAHNRPSKAVNTFARTVLFDGELPRRHVELAVLRMGWNCQSVYEFGQHTLFGRDAGLSDEEIYFITRPSTEHAWTDEEAVDPADGRRPLRRRLRQRRDLDRGVARTSATPTSSTCSPPPGVPHGQRVPELRRRAARRRCARAGRARLLPEPRPSGPAGGATPATCATPGFTVTPPGYPRPIADHPVLEAFSPAVRAWFGASFPEPTAAQIQGWPPITAGDHTLICAPTGSGKTLAAFLSSIDRLVTTPPTEDRTRRTRVLYISPLRALAFDVEKNLRAPLAGIALAAERLGELGRRPRGGHAHRRHGRRGTARSSCAARPTC